MAAHSWIVEEVDGGPMGSDDVYRCTVCGCCGGGSTRVTGWFSPEKSLRIENRDPDPFLPGPAIDLSDDCDVAREQIAFFIHGELRGMWAHYHRQDDVEGKEIAHLLTGAHKWTPRAVARVPLAHLVFDCEHKTRPSLPAVGERLAAMGFRVEPPTCSKCKVEPAVVHTGGDDTNPLCGKCMRADP